MMASKLFFELLDGEVQVWIDQEAIRLRAGDLKSHDPVELTGKEGQTIGS